MQCLNVVLCNSCSMMSCNLCSLMSGSTLTQCKIRWGRVTWCDVLKYYVCDACNACSSVVECNLVQIGSSLSRCECSYVFIFILCLCKIDMYIFVVVCVVCTRHIWYVCVHGMYIVARCCTFLCLYTSMHRASVCLCYYVCVRVCEWLWMYVRWHKYVVRMRTQGWGHVDLCIWHHVTRIGQRWQILSPARHDRHGGTRSAFARWVSGMADFSAWELTCLLSETNLFMWQLRKRAAIWFERTQPPPGKVRYILTKGVQELSSGDHHRRLLFKVFRVSRVITWVSKRWQWTARLRTTVGLRYLLVALRQGTLKLSVRYHSWSHQDPSFFSARRRSLLHMPHQRCKSRWRRAPMKCKNALKSLNFRQQQQLASSQLHFHTVGLLYPFAPLLLRILWPHSVMAMKFTRYHA